MTAICKTVYNDKLPEIVKKYNSTIHRTTKIKRLLMLMNLLDTGWTC